MAKLNIPINADAGQFLKVIQEVLKSAEQAQKAIQSAFGDSAKVQINDSAIKDALSATEKLAKELKSMDGKVNVNDSDIDEAQKKVKKLDGSKAKVNVEVETAGLDQLKDAFSGGLIGGAIGGGGLAEIAEAGLGAVISGFSSAYESGIEFNTALGNLQAQTGATAEEFEQLKEASENAFIGGVGESVAEATDIIANAQVRLGDFLDPKQLSEFTVGAQALGTTFDLDVNEVITKASPVMKQFGLDSKEAFDLFSLALQDGSSASDDILDTLSEYSQLTQEAGFSALQFTEALARGSEAGVFNTDKIGDAIKEAQIRIKSGDFNTAFAGLSEGASEGEKSVIDLVSTIAKKAQSGELSIEEALQLSSEQIDKAFNAGEITDSLASNLQTAIAGTPAEDLGRDVYSRIFSAPFDEDAIRKKAQEAGQSISGAIGQYTSFEEVQREFDLFITKLSQGFIVFADEVIAPLFGGIVEVVGGIKDAFDDVFGDFELGSGLTDGLGGLVDLFNIIIGLLRDRLSAIFRAVFGTIKGILTSVYRAFEPIIEIIKDVINSFSGAGSSFEGFGKIMKDVGDIIGLVGELIFDLLITPMELAIDIFVDIARWVGNFITELIGVGDAGTFFNDIIDKIGFGLLNVKGTIGGVISAFRAFKDAIKDLDIGKIASDLLSGKNPFAEVTEKLSSAYDEGFNEATDKYKKSAEEQGKIGDELFNRINSQITELAGNRDNLSNKEISAEKNKLSNIIKTNLDASKLIEGDAVKLGNALEQIKIKEVANAKASSKSIKDSIIDLSKFTKDLFTKNSITLGIKTDFELSDIGIEEALKFFTEDFAITGDTDLLDEVQVELDKIVKLKKGLTDSEQFVQLQIEGTDKIISDLSAIRNETKELKTLEKDKLSLNIDLGLTDDPLEKDKILKDLAILNEKIIAETIKSANKSNVETEKIQAITNKKLENLRLESSETLSKEIEKKELDLIKIREGLTITSERDLTKLKLDLADETQEVLKQREIIAVEEKYSKLLNDFRDNEQAKIIIRNAFNKELEAIDEKYIVKTTNLYEELAKTLSLSLASFDPSAIIDKNKDIEESISSVKSEYELETEALDEQLAKREISYSEYSQKIVELEEKKSEKLKELQDEQIGFIGTFQIAFADSLGLMAETLKESLASQSEEWNKAGENFLENAETLTSALEGTLAVAGAQFAQLVVEGKAGFNDLLGVVLSSVSSIIDLLMAQIVAQGAAAAPFGLGVPAALGLAALVKGLLSAAQAGIGGANDGVIGLSESNKGKPSGADSILMALAPNESVITASATAKNKPYLEFINKGGDLSSLITPNVSINPKYSNSNNMGDTNKRLDQTNNELSELRKDMRKLRVNHFYDKQPTVNVNNTIELKTKRGVL